MFCPDCGRESVKSDRYCAVCGYPLDLLRERLHDEEAASFGWAEKIIGKSFRQSDSPPDPAIISFETGEEKPSGEDEEKEELKCERCGAEPGVGVMCPACGDKLPTLGESDPYIIYVLRSILRIIIAPKHFALNLPYPMKGGTLQAYLWPGVFAAIYILTMPMSRPGILLETENPVNPVTTALVGMAVYALGVPLILYLSAGLIHWTARIFGGRAPFRRTARAAGAGLIVLLLLGILRHFYLFIVFLSRPLIVKFLEDRLDVEFPQESFFNPWRFLLIALVVVAGWHYAWMFGGLHRLSWWKTAVHFLATYVALLWWIWVFILIILPLRAGGYI